LTRLLLDLARCRVIFEAFRALSRQPIARLSDPPGLRPPSARYEVTFRWFVARRHRRPKTSTSRAGPQSPGRCKPTSSPGIRSCPSIGSTSCVHSRSRRYRRFLRLRAASSKSCSVLEVLHLLDGLLRTELAGLLHPAPDLDFVGRLASASEVWGSPRFTFRDPDGWPPGSAGTIPAAPNSPRRIPLTRSRTTSPWSLPPCRCPLRTPRSLPEVASTLRICSAFAD